SSAICAGRPARAVPPPPAARPARSSFGAIAGSIVHNLDTSHIPAGAFGPFRPDVGLVERVAGLRALAALVSVHCGSDHAAVDALRRAEADAGASDRALAEFDKLPALRRRHVVATYARLMRPHGLAPATKLQPTNTEFTAAVGGDDARAPGAAREHPERSHQQQL